MSKETGSSHYRADIDGLRAIAVVSVLLFHAFPRLMPGGFTGVDIFFVISGYLISGIVFSNFDRNAFSYRDFYRRRIKRIFPALALVLGTVLILGWLTLFPAEYKDLGTNVAGAAGFFSNILLLRQAGYFDTAGGRKVLLHLWSLGVEEQFYLFWPLLVGIAWRRRWNFLAITLALGAASFALSCYWTYTRPDAAFYLPLPRFWELMVGGVLAYLKLHPSREFRLPSGAASVAGALLLATGFLFIRVQDPFPG